MFTFKKSILRIAASSITAFAMLTTAFAPSTAQFKSDSNNNSTVFLSIESIEAEAANYSTGKYIVNTSSGLNVRSGPSTGYSRVGSARNGTSFTVTEVRNGWGKTNSISCTNGTRSGWVCLSYCKYQNSNTSSATSSYTINTDYYVKVTASSLNMRTSYSTSASRITSIPRNTTLRVTKTSRNGWGFVNYNGKSGWISLNYTRLVNNSSNASVNLNVPVMKQGDSRWGNVKIGRNGTKTIAQCGCIISAAAMAYSYKNNTTVFPDVMMRSRLDFIGNRLIWSTLHDDGFSSTEYYKTINQSIMQNIYNKLKEGKPVIIYCKNSAGREHAVVVTGYNGSTTTFSPSNFTIIDPGYNRTNLQEHLNYVNVVQRIIY